MLRNLKLIRSMRIMYMARGPNSSCCEDRFTSLGERVGPKLLVQTLLVISKGRATPFIRIHASDLA